MGNEMKIVWIVSAAVWALTALSFAAQAADPICGGSFVTSEVISRDLSSCNVIGEVGGVPYGVAYSAISPAGSQAISLAGFYAGALSGGGALIFADIYCTDDIGNRSEVADPSLECVQPGSPGILPGLGGDSVDLDIVPMAP
jgi:hypothetical protein